MKRSPIRIGTNCCRYRLVMASIKYIHPDFKEAVSAVSPEIKKEVGYSFDIAARIRSILVKKGLSQAEFARMIGKKEAEISRWMSGTHNFTIRTISVIETVLGETVISVKKPY